jgi:hypothetical protein
MEKERSESMSEERFAPEWREAVEVPEPETEQVEEEQQVDRSNDPEWIRVETPEYQDGAELGQATAGLNIRTGRTLVSYRKRKLPEEEEGLEFVYGEPVMPVPLLENTKGPSQEGERDSDWRPGVDPALLRKFLRSTEAEPGKQDSSSTHNWIRGGFGR